MDCNCSCNHATLQYTNYTTLHYIPRRYTTALAQVPVCSCARGLVVCPGARARLLCKSESKYGFAQPVGRFFYAGLTSFRWPFRHVTSFFAFLLLCPWIDWARLPACPWIDFVPRCPWIARVPVPVRRPISTTATATTTHTRHATGHNTTAHSTQHTALQHTTHHYATLHYITLHYARPCYTTPHSTTLQLQLQLPLQLHYATVHYTHYTTPQLQLQLKLHYANCTTLQVQAHYTTTTAALHRTTSGSCGWGDHCNHCSHTKKTTPTTFRSISCFAIHASPQLTSLVVSYPWNFRHRIAGDYWYTYVTIYRQT